jgi:hypothetical protein
LAAKAARLSREIAKVGRDAIDSAAAGKPQEGFTNQPHVVDAQDVDSLGRRG